MSSLEDSPDASSPYAERRIASFSANRALVQGFLIASVPMRTAQLFELYAFINAPCVRGDELSALNYVLVHENREEYEKAEDALRKLDERMQREAQHNQVYKMRKNLAAARKNY